MRALAVLAGVIAAVAVVPLAPGRDHAAHGGCAPAEVALPGPPGPLALDDNTLWVGIHGTKRGRLLALDAGSGRTSRSFRLPFDPLRIVPAFGSLWLTGQGGDHRYAGVLQVNPRTGAVVRVVKAKRTLGTAIAATASALWVGGPDIYPPGEPENSGVYLLYKIDPRRGAVAARYRLRSTVIDLLGDGHRLWVSGWYAIVQLSEHGRVLQRHPIAGSAWSITRAPGGVWVAHTFLGRRGTGVPPPAFELFRVRGSHLETIPLADSPWQVSSAGGVLWFAAGEDSRAVQRLSGAPVSVVGTIRSIQAMPGAVWVADEELRLNQAAGASAAATRSTHDSSSSSSTRISARVAGSSRFPCSSNLSAARETSTSSGSVCAPGNSSASRSWRCALAVPLIPVVAPMTATGLPSSTDCRAGREAQSIAFLSTPDVPRLYSGVASKSASARSIASRKR
jgi:hypothetical protein